MNYHVPVATVLVHNRYRRPVAAVATQAGITSIANTSTPVRARTVLVYTDIQIVQVYVLSTYVLMPVVLAVRRTSVLVCDTVYKYSVRSQSPCRHTVIQYMSTGKDS